MYEGKRMNPKSSAKIKLKLALLVSLILMLTVGTSATIAWLTDTSNDVENVFTLAQVPPTINEDWNGSVKQNVTVTNSGDVSAYIRAAIVVTWKDSEGNVAPVVPALGTDYTMETITSGGWSAKQSDGFYYYTAPVAAKDTTGALISRAEQLQENGDYKLVIEILAQTIQADGKNSAGETPVKLAWGENAAKLVGAISG